MQQESKRVKGYARMRATLHIGMGIFYIVVASLMLYAKYFGAVELPTTMAYTLGTLALLYGIFRVYRGFADLRAKQDDI